MRGMDDERRHQCEVRWLLRQRAEHGSEWAADWLAGVESKRGKPAADRIKADATSQWKAGNRGEWNDWR